MSGFAFCFPGQGSQSVGMLGALRKRESLIEETLIEAEQSLGLRMRALIDNGPEDELRLTFNAQPALLACEIAIWRLWKERGGADPAAMAGHSLGEFSALVCADSLEFGDALRLVRRRGELMQEAAPIGSGVMCAIIGLEDAVIERCCEQAAKLGEVSPANYNAPGQLVIAGSADATRRAAELCRQAGARRVAELPVSAPFHTSLMRPAAAGLAEMMATIEMRPPGIPVAHNLHGDFAKPDESLSDLLLRQLHQPVRWSDCVRALRGGGVGIAAECGPGKVLCGLNRRIDKNLQCLSLDEPESFDAALEFLS